MIQRSKSNLMIRAVAVMLISICGNATELFAQQTRQLAAASDTMHSKWIRETEASRLGKPYPAFNFKLSDGQEVNSALLKGKVVVIDCWFQSCQPCIAEVEGLNALNDSLAQYDDIVFFTIARERPEDLPQILKEKNMRYPATAQPQMTYSYNLGGGFPTKIIVGRDGLVNYFHTGGRVNKEEAWRFVMTEFLTKILEEAKR